MVQLNIFTGAWNTQLCAAQHDKNDDYADGDDDDVVDDDDDDDDNYDDDDDGKHFC